MINVSRVLVACVAENREPYAREVVLLFKSLRMFGGELSCAPAVACFVKSIDSRVHEELLALSVNVKIVEPVDERCPHANKIRMLEEWGGYDFLVALDTDVVIVRDFSGYLESAAISAKPVDQDPLRIDQWQKLFDYFGLSLPQTRYMTSFNFSETIPYFNSGVVLIPGALVSHLRVLWKSYVDDLLSAYKHFPDIADHKFFTDQFAFALAIAKGRLPFRALPLDMNFPTHHTVHPLLEPEKCSPYIMHHHHRVTEECSLMLTKYDLVNRAICEINSRILGEDYRVRHCDNV